MKTQNKLFKRLIFLGMVLHVAPVMAQDSSDVRKEGWPEVNVFYKLADQWRLYGMYSATKIRTSDYTDGATGAYIDYFTLNSIRKRILPHLYDSVKGYYLWFRSGYYYSSTPGGAENPVTEHTISVEANSRFYLPKNFLLTVQNRFDYRMVNKADEPRYRPRLTIERDLQTIYLQYTPYLYCDYFFNFNDSESDRFRVCAGIELRVAKYVNLETYYLYQIPVGDNVSELNAIGLALKFYLSRQAVHDVFGKKKGVSD